MTFTQNIDDQIASINYHNPPPMAVNITQPQDDQFMVNGKLVYQDSEQIWKSSEELTVNEQKAFRKHLESIKTGVSSIHKST